ncbi:CRTAC1 family protein [Adhaeretor mobilis]|nr:CRTAC1 family protein [Adhaeretor mobilis]
MKYFVIFVGSLLAFILAQRDDAIADDKPSKAQPHFVEAEKDFPREEKNLRKWDAPIVADLDQDGFLDLILNDHGFGVRICWNNKGRFAKPYDLVMGDLHGITVGDLDQDGNLELVISPGGGSGSNARNATLYRVDRQRKFTKLPGFKVPLKLMRGRTVKLMDGDNDGDLDLLNFAFPSREKRKQSENYIYENTGTGHLELVGVLPKIEMNGQKTLVTDFNNDSILDLLLYGHGHVKANQGKGDLTFDEVTDTVLRSHINDVTSIVEIDYDNDGDVDLYCTRGKEFTAGETFYDSETQTWGFYTTRGAFQFEDLVVGDILKIENYQAQWPNKKLCIGESAYEYEFPGETHSGRDIRLVNSDALGWPEKVEAKSAYLGYVGNEAWRFAGDIFSPTTGVMHGIRSYPAYDHPKGLSDVLLENQNGQYAEVTLPSGIRHEDHTTGVAVGDFDNNGYQDLLVIRRGDLIHTNQSLLYLNQGDKTFELVDDHNIVSPELGAIGLGTEVLDYNRDGKLDILIGNERGKWHLFKNKLTSGSDSNYLLIEITNSKANHATSLGAVVEVTADGITQTKRVGSTSAAYSLGRNTLIHFGLGENTGPVDIKVEWTIGETVQQTVSKLNRLVKIAGESPE